MTIELRWLRKPSPFELILQFREIEEGDDGYDHYGPWQDVPVVDQE